MHDPRNREEQMMKQKKERETDIEREGEICLNAGYSFEKSKGLNTEGSNQPKVMWNKAKLRIYKTYYILQYPVALYVPR